MVKLDPALIDEKCERTTCIDCGSENLTRDAAGLYVCGACGAHRPRAVIITPDIRWWLAADGEYWHQTAGIFVRNDAGEYLLFRRTRFPFGLTIPAGHVEVDEDPAHAARRELLEETSLDARALHHLGDVDIPGDSCRRGADAHRWNCFVTEAGGTQDVVLNQEGISPVWRSLPEMRAATELTLATSFLVNLYDADLRPAAHAPGRGR
ncbi:NUDIX domain-containing protein [Actinoplanes awajinensis]|uniref:Nudix hydrolase domain-containing protein n=1 Tax=Actinoplanes awajinensis subsp. mycoplanecinus TaxID=135947 RepID=A0A117MMN1_9ACTN|nr:NUDIX domain-containing protein [Actinoplanes awajinensis]KUL25794.1 hypothetical protein ADL15_39445 [Actinoplanes awajinensis subsp. mycoplanecinus]